MDEPILRVKNLRVAFGDLEIFKNLEFNIEKGETAAIIGPNGSGKTVLARALIGTIPFEGEIDWSPNSKIGYVPQIIELDRNLTLTLEDFLMLKVNIFELPRYALKEAISLVHLSEARLKIPLPYLSGGELQRAFIAFALIGSPNVLLFDEPTAGVDLPGEEQIYQTLHHLQDIQNLTLIFISHDLNIVYRYADKVICLNRALFCFGTPKETLTPQILDQLYGSKVMHHIHPALQASNGHQSHNGAVRPDVNHSIGDGNDINKHV